jgi:hypothetical protein
MDFTGIADVMLANHLLSGNQKRSSTILAARNAFPYDSWNMRL